MIALFNLLKKEKNSYCLFKGNIIYFDNRDIPNYDFQYSFIEDYKEYLFHILHNDLNVSIENSIKINDYSIFNEIPFEKLDNFRLPSNRFFSKGNSIIFYFSSEYISNPLDILYTLSSVFILQNTYSNIVLDYIPYKNKLLYYCLFQFSNNFKEHYYEILKNIEKIMSISNIKSKKSLFSKEQILFEKREVKKFNSQSLFKNNINYEGIRYFTPHINIKGFRRDFFEFN